MPADSRANRSASPFILRSMSARIPRGGLINQIGMDDLPSGWPWSIFRKSGLPVFRRKCDHSRNLERVAAHFDSTYTERALATLYAHPLPDQHCRDNCRSEEDRYDIEGL